MTGRPAPAMNGPAITVQHFAEAIAARTDALRVYPTQLNDTEERRWADELFQLPVAVYVAAPSGFRCLAFDFDSARGDAGADSAACAGLLAESGIKALVCDSGPGGGRHVLSTWEPVVASETVHRIADVLRRRYRSLDSGPLVNPATGCIRPPLSLHRLGGISTASADVRQGLAILEEGNDRDALRRLLGAFGLVPLSRGIESALRKGHIGTRYRTPSEARFAVGLAIFNAGGSRTDFIDEVQRSPLAYRGDGEEVSVRDLDRDWVRVEEKALKLPAIRSRRDAVARLCAVRSAVLADPGQWVGRTGATDRRVYFAHLAVAVRTGKLAPEVSLREIAELAALGSISTVMASRKRRRAVAAYEEFAADRLLWEANFGGEMVELVVRTAAKALGVTAATRRVVASRGKRLRAEPIAALFEQGKVRLVGAMPDLEDQLVTFTADGDGSPDRLDAMVMGLTDLMLRRDVPYDMAGLVEANPWLSRPSSSRAGATPRDWRPW